MRTALIVGGSVLGAVGLVMLVSKMANAAAAAPRGSGGSSELTRYGGRSSSGTAGGPPAPPPPPPPSSIGALPGPGQHEKDVDPLSRQAVSVCSSYGGGSGVAVDTCTWLNDHSPYHYAKAGLKKLKFW